MTDNNAGRLGSAISRMVLEEAEKRRKMREQTLKKAYRDAMGKRGGAIRKAVVKTVADTAEKAAKEIKSQFKNVKAKAADLRKDTVNKADERVTRTVERAARASGDMAAPVTFGASAAAGKTAAVMQEAGLQARKAGREAATAAGKSMSDKPAPGTGDKAGDSGMALISDRKPDLGLGDWIR